MTGRQARAVWLPSPELIEVSELDVFVVLMAFGLLFFYLFIYFLKCICCLSVRLIGLKDRSGGTEAGVFGLTSVQRLTAAGGPVEEASGGKHREVQEGARVCFFQTSEITNLDLISSLLSAITSHRDAKGGLSI